jgi:glycosyltransferase involved in cell wall biosynthesis
VNAGDDGAVDVVIPVRNGAHFLKACLDGVMAQTRAPRAVIVVDDGSTDTTPQILAEYGARWPRLSVIRSDPMGVSHARNLGIRAGAAPYVAFLDSDDVWAPEKLERQMATLLPAAPRLGIVYCAYRCIDVNGQVLEDHQIIEPRLRGKVFCDLLMGGNTISGSTSAVVARRDLLERVGGFDERFFFGEDWDLWLRLAKITEIDFVPEALVSIRLHDSSTQHAEDLQKNERFLHQSLLIIDRWYGTPMFPVVLRSEYRRTVVHLAILRAKRQPVLQVPRQLELFWKIKSESGRFGRDLFSGRFDFFAAICATRLNSLWRRLRRFLTKNLTWMSGPTRFQA